VALVPLACSSDSASNDAAVDHASADSATTI
jgi:hypothetical protein